MTLVGLAYMLLGAGLVAFGVLAAAAADRIRHRGVRHAAIDAELAAAETPARRPASKPATPVYPQTFMPAARRAPAESFEVVSPVVPRPVARPVKPAATIADDAMAKDVISALTSAGYKKPAVAAAVAACEASERVSLEAFTRAALRRCARGAA